MPEIIIKLAAAFFVSLGILRLTTKANPNAYSIRFISGYYTFQFAVLFMYLFNDPDAKIWTGFYDKLLLRNYLDRGILGYLIFQTSILFAAFIGRFMFPVKNKLPLIENIKKNKTKLRYPLLFTAIVVLCYPFLSYVPGIGYANSILFNFLLFIPFIAGVLFFEDKYLRVVWLVALAVIFVMGIMTGGRGTAMTSGAIYAIGFYYSLSTAKAKRIALITGIVIAVPMMTFLAFVGIFRHTVGRVDFSEITWERAVRIYQTYEKLKDSKVVNLNSEEGRLHGWGRFINFVNFTQFATVPSKKEHLGAEDLFTVDFKYSFDVSFISGTTTQDRINARFGNFRLNNYGYWVTEETSVEYSIVTEAFIRFGYWGLFFFGLSITLFAISLEFFVVIFSKGFPAIYFFSIVLLCQQALLGYAYNTFVIMRNMMISLFISFTLIYLLTLIKLLFNTQKASINSKYQ